jgi:hypothetical protein
MTSAGADLPASGFEWQAIDQPRILLGKEGWDLSWILLPRWAAPHGCLMNEARLCGGFQCIHQFVPLLHGRLRTGPKSA